MKRRFGWLLGLFAIAAIALALPSLRELAAIQAGYTALQMCACVYVSERSENACKNELEEPHDKLVRWHAEGGRVEAQGLLGLAHATADFEVGLGCVLQD